MGFYALRHTFDTIGAKPGSVAVNDIMGHAPPDSDMASVYRERISDELMKAVPTTHMNGCPVPNQKRRNPRKSATIAVLPQRASNCYIHGRG